MYRDENSRTILYRRLGDGYRHLLSSIGGDRVYMSKMRCNTYRGRMLMRVQHSSPARRRVYGEEEG